ncbi:diphthine--ammonia ligase [Coemansia sp. RSA 455]|nr:diphthine--ammonia ligase [Coemansia sp. RSA 455]
MCSGGKDSTYNMMKCVEDGHEIIALAHAHPPEDAAQEELDSYLFQTVGSSAVATIAECMDLPFYLQVIAGSAITQTLDYELTKDDETEDLFALLSNVKRHHPDVAGVSVGAIFSSYQANRVQHVCDRLGLTMLAYLWHREQVGLLREMVHDGVEAILIKVAAMGLGKDDLGITLKQAMPKLISLSEKYGVHACGEGGEFESFTLDCPLFKKRIVIDEVETIVHSPDIYSPVLYLKLKALHTEPNLVISLVWIAKICFIDSSHLTTSRSIVNNAADSAPRGAINHSPAVGRTNADANDLSLQLSGPVPEYALAFTDHIYCINEMSKLGRKGRMTELFNYMHLRVEMFSRKHSTHIDVWRDMINSGYDRALVVEDDVDFELDSVAVINRALGALNSTSTDWDILYIGHCSMEENQRKAHSAYSRLHKSTHPFCTSGYLLSRNGAKKLFAYFIEHYQQARALDIQLVALIKRKLLKSYSIYPPVVYQRRDLYPSDDGMELKIAKKFKNSAWNEALAFVPRLANWVDPLDSVYLHPAFKHIPSWMEDGNTVN